MAAIREKKKQTWHLTAEARQKENMKMMLSSSIPDEYSSRHINVCVKLDACSSGRHFNMSK